MQKKKVFIKEKYSRLELAFQQGLHYVKLLIETIKIYVVYFFMLFRCIDVESERGGL